MALKNCKYFESQARLNKRFVKFSSLYRLNFSTIKLVLVSCVFKSDKYISDV